jgi:hypothetical protein
MNVTSGAAVGNWYTKRQSQRRGDHNKRPMFVCKTLLKLAFSKIQRYTTKPPDGRLRRQNRQLNGGL